MVTTPSVLGQDAQPERPTWQHLKKSGGEKKKHGKYIQRLLVITNERSTHERERERAREDPWSSILMRLLLLIPLGHNVRSWSSGSGSRVHVHAYYVLHYGASPSWLLRLQVRPKAAKITKKAHPREADALQRRRTQKGREWETELQTLIKYSGSSPRAEWPFWAHAQDLQAPISFIASCYFSRVRRVFDFWKNRDPGCFETTYQNFKNLRFSEFFYFYF